MDGPKGPTKQQFGRKLYRLMIERTWTQSELARQAGVGRDEVSHWVNGRAYPSPDDLAKLASALDVAPNDLLPDATAASPSNVHSIGPTKHGAGDMQPPPEVKLIKLPADLSEALDRFMASPECPEGTSREEAIVLLLREALTAAGYMPAWGR